MKETTYFTTGQLSKWTGLTLRTLRYYDQIGLLTPDKEHTGAVRRYGVDDLRRLQQIQTLKYVGLSLDEIGDLLAAEAGLGWKIRNSLLAQLDVVRQKMLHTENVVKVIRGVLEDADGLGEGDGVIWRTLFRPYRWSRSGGSSIGMHLGYNPEYTSITDSVPIHTGGTNGYSSSLGRSRMFICLS